MKQTQWRVWFPDHGEEPHNYRLIEAYEGDEAAEKAVAELDFESHPRDGCSITAHVQPAPGSPATFPQVYEVIASLEWSYCTTLKKEGQ